MSDTADTAKDNNDFEYGGNTHSPPRLSGTLGCRARWGVWAPQGMEPYWNYYRPSLNCLQLQNQKSKTCTSPKRSSVHNRSRTTRRRYDNSSYILFSFNGCFTQNIYKNCNFHFIVTFISDIVVFCSISSDYTPSLAIPCSTVEMSPSLNTGGWFCKVPGSPWSTHAASCVEFCREKLSSHEPRPAFSRLRSSVSSVLKQAFMAEHRRTGTQLSWSQQRERDTEEHLRHIFSYQTVQIHDNASTCM